MIAPKTPKAPMPLKKKLLYLLGGIVALLLVAAILLPSNIETTVSEEIKAPVNYVYNLLSNQQNIPTWNSWSIDDKEMKIVYDKPTSGIGSGYSWTSPSSGDGSVVYTAMVPNQKLDAELTMGGDKSSYTILLEKAGEDKTKISWSFRSHMGFPMNLMGPVLKYIVNKQNKKSFDHIEAEVGRRQAGQYFGHQIKEGTQNARHFATVRGVVSFDKIAQYYSQNLAAIYQKLQDEGISSVGAPCALFYSYDEKKQQTEMAVAVPVLAPVSIQDLTSVSLPVQNAAYVDYYGDPAQTANAHYGLDEYLKDRAYSQSVPVIEEYVTDPIKEKEQSKWLTKIYYYTAEKK